jgi:prepilin-type N-terminal cleavage/methylation domain-containing protein
MLRGKVLEKAGFTLIELVLVVTIIGLISSMIIPRAMRAMTDAKFSLVRQNATETGAYVLMWAQNMAACQGQDKTSTVYDYLMGQAPDANAAAANTKLPSLAGHYTGNDAFDCIEKVVTKTQSISNPFNAVSIFDRLNDDRYVPGHQPGLLYLAAAPDPPSPKRAGGGLYNFYFVFTNTDNGWYGLSDANDPNEIQRGIFVARLSPNESFKP